MSIADLFAYYLDANYSYNEELKELFINSKLYDFCHNERDLIAFTPNSGRIYVKTKNKQSTYVNTPYVYYEAKKTISDKYQFDGGNIIIGDQEAILKAIELVRKHSMNNIHRRLLNHLVISINETEVPAILINKIGEELELIINSINGILFIRYDYQDNSFYANFDIDWYTLTESTIDDLYIPDTINKYIKNGGCLFNYPTTMKEITIIKDADIGDKKRYFYGIR